MLRTRYASRLQRKALSTIDWMLSSQASDVINQFHIHRLRTGDPVGGGTWQFAKRDTREHGTTEMAGSEWGKPYSWSIKLCKSAPAKSAVGDHIYSPLLLLLAIIQKRTQYLCYGLLKKKWKWRIFLGQDRTAGPKLSLFSKMFD